MTTWLLLDCSYLCYRAHYAMSLHGDDGVSTAATFGFLRDLPLYARIHQTQRFVFCFDGGDSKRKELMTAYKCNRQKQTPGQLEVHEDIKMQIERLRTLVLPDLGFKNIFRQIGYEADDLLAAISRSLPGDDDCLLLSSDNDLYQLLTDRCILWNPMSKKAYNRASLKAEYGVTPEQWPEVKAMAGCRTDNVEGIPGVGLKTASRYLANGNPRGVTVSRMKAIKESAALIARNRKLVTLPFPGVRDCRLVSDNVKRDDWNRVVQRLGMRSLIGQYGS